MRLNSPLVRGSLLLGLLVQGACSISPMNLLGTHTPKFTARLSGSQEVPPNTAPGSGMLEATLNTHTRLLTWSVRYSGLSGPVTAAHFHGPAAPGRNAGVALPFSGSLASPIEGEARLGEAQVDDLLAGRWYLNLHTAAHPGGEIRGQLVMRR